MKEITIECNGKRSAALQISEMQHSVQFCSFFCSDRHFSNGGSFYSQCPEMCAQKIEYNSVNPYEREIWFSSLHFHQAMAQCEGVRARSAIYCTDSNRVHLTKISNQRSKTIITSDDKKLYFFQSHFIGRHLLKYALLFVCMHTK